MSATQTQWLSFRLSGQLYAAPLDQVHEVVRDGEVTPVPGAASDILGVRHLRGRIVPVIEGRARLAIDGAEPNTADIRVLMLAHGSHLVGVRVDSVGELITVDANNVEPPPPGCTVRDYEPVEGVHPSQHGFVALLNVRRLCRLPATDAA